VKELEKESGIEFMILKLDFGSMFNVLVLLVVEVGRFGCLHL
jgi:hypothetical protein